MSRYVIGVYVPVCTLEESKLLLETQLWAIYLELTSLKGVGSTMNTVT
ncbi:MAG: hypothetical protein OXM02_12400 [Bacteroidota bacterium]|nr:hypothetical protein [Bacteroidota bacterium]MDE2835303.1 hypothetical protein [Bacteroidota bacterium]